MAKARSPIRMIPTGLVLVVAGFLAVSAQTTATTLSVPAHVGAVDPGADGVPTARAEASCQASLQAEIDSAEPGATLDLTGCAYLAGATIDKPLTLLGASVRTPAGETALTVSANGFDSRATVIVRERPE